jgi:uncharacterized protein
MAVSREPAQGVVRVSGSIRHPRSESTAARQPAFSGYRCILCTDLGNPTSNCIYRRIGYRAVAEAIRYRFD